MLARFASRVSSRLSSLLVLLPATSYLPFSVPSLSLSSLSPSFSSDMSFLLARTRVANLREERDASKVEVGGGVEDHLSLRGARSDWQTSREGRGRKKDKRANERRESRQTERAPFRACPVGCKGEKGGSQVSDPNFKHLVQSVCLARKGRWTHVELVERGHGRLESLSGSDRHGERLELVGRGPNDVQRGRSVELIFRESGQGDVRVQSSSSLSKARKGGSKS